MSQTNIGYVHHTERDASESSVSVTRVYFQPHATLADTYVLGTASGDATAWLHTSGGITKLDDDETEETNVPYLINSTTVIV